MVAMAAPALGVAHRAQGPRLVPAANPCPAGPLLQETREPPEHRPPAWAARLANSAVHKVRSGTMAAGIFLQMLSTLERPTA